MDAALADAWQFPFDVVVRLHALPEAVSTAWRDAACALEVTEPLTPFPDVVRGLQQLALRRLLLTTGFRRLQESKLRYLSLTPLFEAVYVDALDPAGPGGKRTCLERLLAEQALDASEVIVIGDRADDELSAGAALGMTVVQVLRPGVVADLTMALQIQDLTVLARPSSRGLLEAPLTPARTALNSVRRATHQGLVLAILCWQRHIWSGLSVTDVTASALANVWCCFACGSGVDGIRSLGSSSGFQ